MEPNKLTEITRQLYEEGLSKGRAEGERVVAEAEAQAAKLISEAREEARKITDKAASDAAELRQNTMTEIALAGRQAVAQIKEQIASVVVARSIGGGVSKAGIDPEFIREILLSVARNWRGGAEKVSLGALLPADKQKELDAALAGSTAVLLKEGIEVGYSPAVKSGFRVGEKDGGYYIGFSDENFEALLGGYLREKVTGLLYGER